MSKTTATYCLKIAKSALQSSDIERAKDFLKRAEQALPSVRTEFEEFEELYNIAHHGSHTKKSSSTSNGHYSNSHQPSSSHSSSASSPSSSSSSHELTDIEEILRHKDDYYRVLSGLPIFHPFSCLLKKVLFFSHQNCDSCGNQKGIQKECIKISS